MRLEQKGALENAEKVGVSPELGDVGEAVLDLLAEFTPPEAGHSAGARLDHSLAMDQRLREARTRVMQRRIHAAHRAETHARSVCVAAGLGSILLWIGVFLPSGFSGGRVGADSIGQLFTAILIVVGFSVGISLPVAAVTAVGAARWRKHLLRTAAAQHLPVRDPARGEGV